MPEIKFEKIITANIATEVNSDKQFQRDVALFRAKAMELFLVKEHRTDALAPTYGYKYQDELTPTGGSVYASYQKPLNGTRESIEEELIINVVAVERKRNGKPKNGTNISFERTNHINKYEKWRCALEKRSFYFKKGQLFSELEIFARNGENRENKNHINDPIGSFLKRNQYSIIRRKVQIYDYENGVSILYIIINDNIYIYLEKEGIILALSCSVSDVKNYPFDYLDNLLFGASLEEIEAVKYMEPLKALDYTKAKKLIIKTASDPKTVAWQLNSVYSD